MTTQVMLQPYPLAEGLVPSTLFAIEAEGCPIATEHIEKSCPLYAPIWFQNPSVAKTLEVHSAAFACAGPTRVTITVQQPFTSFLIRPKSRNIPAVRDGNTITLSLPGPCKLYVEVDDHPPLLIFADPPEEDIPEFSTSAVHVFGPGVHQPGLINLVDGDAVYLAPGAIVYGGFSGSPRRARIFGRGILDGSRLNGPMVSLHGATDVEFEGITLRCGEGWQNTLMNCCRISYRNVKVLCFAPYGDGISMMNSRDIRITDCLFHCSDDCIAVRAHHHSPDVTRIYVEDCVMAAYAFGDGFTIGYDVNAQIIEDIRVANCDILYALRDSKVDGHSAFSIICDGPSTIRNVCFDNIRVEEKIRKLFELHVTDGTKYGHGTPGRIQDVRLSNIAWEVEKPIIIRGQDELHTVERVSFTGCTVAGQPLGDCKDRLLQMNGFAREITVTD